MNYQFKLEQNAWNNHPFLNRREKYYCLTLYIRCEMNAPHNAHVDVFGWDPLILMISVGVPFVHLFVRLLSQIWQNTQICTRMWYQTIYFVKERGLSDAKFNISNSNEHFTPSKMFCRDRIWIIWKVDIMKRMPLRRLMSSFCRSVASHKRKEAGDRNKPGCEIKVERKCR
jgi:hypothetical protein